MEALCFSLQASLYFQILYTGIYFGSYNQKTLHKLDILLITLEVTFNICKK